MKSLVADTPESGVSSGAHLDLTVRGMTCGSCADRVRTALEQVAGVEGAEVFLAGGYARVRVAADSASLADLSAAVQAAGYELVLDARGMDSAAPPITAPARAPTLMWPVAAGTIGALLLVVLYLTVVSALQGWPHALGLITSDWYFVAAIALGFGIQVALFLHVRRCRAARGNGASTAAAGAGTGTSTMAMLACCAHHAGDLLPLLGLSGAAVFLNENRIPFMLLGIAGNVIGIAVMVRQLRQHNARACHMAA